MINFNAQNIEKFISNEEMLDYFEKNKECIQKTLHGENKYKDVLGWHDVNEWADENAVSAIEKKAQEIKANATVFVLIGIGGSNQAARAVINALNPTNGIEVICAGNTLSAYELSQLECKLKNKDFYINIIAKNFETLEPGVSFRLLRSLLTKRYGEKSHEKIIVTGTQGSQLHNLAKEHGYSFFTFPHNIGGRYSALSDVGLLPMMVAGVNIRQFINGAVAMQNSLLNDCTIENPAIKYAVIRNILYKKGYRMEILSFFEPRFNYFSQWWTQLFAESEGKESKGIYPIVGRYSEDLHSIGQFVQDGSKIIFETFITVTDKDTILKCESDTVHDGFDYLGDKDFWDINKIAEKATIMAHSDTLPCTEIEINAIDENTLGMLFYFYMQMCYISGSLLEINPFNQDGVEAYKIKMFQLLGK